MSRRQKFQRSDEPFSHTPLSDKVECFAPEDNNDEIDAFLAMEVSSNFEEGYFDSEGDVTFLDNLLSDISHNLASEVRNKMNLRLLFSRIDSALMRFQLPNHMEKCSANQSSVIEFSSRTSIPVEVISDPLKKKSEIFLVPDDLIPLGVENDDSEDEVNELPNLDHQDDPSIPHPPPEPPDVEICLNFEPVAAMMNDFDVLNNDEPFDSGGGENVVFLNVEEDDSFTFTIRTFLPFVTYPEASPLSCSTGSEDTIFDPGIST
ncbi:hypothetical protein Tco_0233570 [Tanacetum coccineum]